MKTTQTELEITVRMQLPEGANSRDAVSLVRTAIQRMESLDSSPIPDRDTEKIKVRVTRKTQVTRYA